jgi:endonuclease/exonuclease/phosphatase family metal-dependent hydrolase
VRALLAALVILLTRSQGPDLTVMSFNLRYGTARDGENAWPMRRDLVVATIAAEDPDILGLQEALRFQLDELEVALPGFGELGVGRDDGVAAGEYAAILYRRERFAVESSGTFWLSDTPAAAGSMSWGNRIPRIATWAVLRDRATGHRFSVFNTHLDHESQSSRERGVALIVERIGELANDLPALVLGDFNVGEDNPAIDPLRQAGFRDTYRVMDREGAGTGTFGAFRGDSTGAKIDYVFARGPWTVLAADILRRRAGTRDPSDHFPVTARLRLEQAVPR